MARWGKYYLLGSNICLTIGLVGFILAIFLKFNDYDTSMGMQFLWGGSLFFLAYSGILRRYTSAQNIKWHKIFGICICIILISFIWTETLIFQAMKTDLPSDCRYVIILGAGLLGDAPSLTLQQRLDAGIIALKKYPEAKVIVSGGIGKESIYTEAEVMKWYLIEHGINEERIIKEEYATRTDENLEFGKELVEKIYGEKINEIVIATSDYHMFRAKILAKKHYDKVYGISAESLFGVRVNYAIREYLALIKMELLNLLPENEV